MGPTLVLVGVSTQAIAADGDILPFPAELPAPVESPAPATLTPLADYQCESIGHLTLLWHPSLATDAQTRAGVRTALVADFVTLAGVLPHDAVEQLGETRVAVNATSPSPSWLPSQGRGLGTHVSSNWLSAHGIHPDRAGVIEVYNTADYLSLRETDPAILLGPLTTLRLRQADGNTLSDVKKAYTNAASGGTFHDERMYATAMAKALFPIAKPRSVAAADVLAHDPAGCKAIARLWGAVAMAECP